MYKMQHLEVSGAVRSSLGVKRLIKKCVSFTAVSIIFVHPLYMLPSYIPWGDWINYVEMYLCKWVFCSVVYRVFLCSAMLLNGFVLLTCFHHSHFLLHVLIY